MVGTLSLCPPYALRTDLLCAQAQALCATATNQHDGKSLLIIRNSVKPGIKNIPLNLQTKSFA